MNRLHTTPEIAIGVVYASWSQVIDNESYIYCTFNLLTYLPPYHKELYYNIIRKASISALAYKAILQNNCNIQCLT